MIILTFYQTTNFDTSAIPSEWRERVRVLRLSLNQTRFRVQIDIDVEDSSYRYRALMQVPQLILKFNLPYYVEFPVGTSCVFQNQTFTLNNPQNLKKQGTQKIEYSITLGTKADNLSLYKLRNTVDGRLKFSMCAKPHEFIEEIVKNLNKRDGEGVWLCNKEHIIDSTEKTVEFNHTDCLSALNSVATTFETEFEIIDNGNGTFEIALHKVEYFKSDPLPLSYGRGNGFVPGVGRTTEADGKPVKRLYVQGGEDNIDRSQYGTMFGYSNNPAELRLPKSQTLEYDGRTYKTDPEGYYIERSDKTSTAVMEDSLDCSEIYPSFIGKVTGVANPNAEKNFYDIIDSTIPGNLNFNNYIIAGESMTIIFQSGMLAGREFEVKYRHDDKRWELVPMEEDGITLPNETFKPQINDTYAVFGIMLPKEYICNNDNKSGAAWDMFREGAKYLYEHEDQKFTFAGELQSLYAKRNWLKIGGYLKVGSYIHFTDSQFAVDGLDIRIIGIKDYINAPYAPTLEISNSIQSATTVSSQLQQIENTEVTIDDTKKKIIQFTKRRFRDALETIGMLEDAKLGEFSGSVAPIAVQTMAMLVGDESLQFVIGNNILTAGKDDWQITYDQSLKQLQCPAGWLKHMTLGIDSIKATHIVTEYLWWQMPEWASPTLDNPSAKYYLYARVQRESKAENGNLIRPTEKGSYVLSETAINIDHEDGYYHLLVGMLNSELYGERSFVTLHGFTEILPGRITTDRIVCSDGNSFLDLAKSALVLGDAFDYNSQGDKTLRLKFLLSENANLGGWIFRNNRLESQNGAVWLDGVNGDVRLAGTVQLSSDYSGNFSDVNLFYLRQSDNVRNITMGYEAEDIGKVVRLYNSNPFGGKSVIVHLATFYINGNVTNAMNEMTAEIAPQETIEVTCFKLPPRNTGEIAAMWTITNRFGLENFRNKTECGRFPQLIAMGTIHSKENPQITGMCFDGQYAQNVFDITRESKGRYLIKRKDEKMISGTGNFQVMLSGRQKTNGDKFCGIVGNGTETYGNRFYVITHVGNSIDEGGEVDFMIFTSTGWEYKM